MRVATLEECRHIDERAQADFSLSGEILMEAAGALAAAEISRLLGRKIGHGQITVVCGPGNNGGDGLVVARHLAMRSLRQSQRLKVLLVGPHQSKKHSNLFLVQLERARKVGLDLVDVNSENLALLSSSGLVVDALFGTGLKFPLEGLALCAVEKINQLMCPVVALDIPSGLDADRGVARGLAVRADLTLSFGVAKRGFFVSDGPSHVGRLIVLPIGFPRRLVKDVALSTEAVDARLAKKLLPQRAKTANKSNMGHAAIFAGRNGMWGAALLAAISAFRSGAGYVTLASHSDPEAHLAAHPEVLTALIDDEVLWKHPRWTAVGVGPGLGVGVETEKTILRLLERGEKKVVLDADALTTLAQMQFRQLPASWILTPHAGELSRLIGVDAKIIEADRFHYAREAANRFGAIVLLKGYRTVIAAPDKTYIVLSGNSALAKAGTGDVLTGLLTGLLAQGLDSVRAAALGAYVHGRIADDWLASGRHRGALVASDVRDLLPVLLERLRLGELS
jgi:hydroxyethylthiazole kinase-like uncharacterized protein yjeF